jgi:predicted RNA-binding protein with PIN domain
LIKIIENENPQGSYNNEVTVFFDGRPGRIDTPGTAHVKVTFTCDHSADDRIRKAVSDAGNKKSCVVVTDDRELGYYVRSLGAKVVTVSEFIAKAKSHRDKKYLEKSSGAKGKETKVIPPSLEYQITSELEQLWLGKKKDKNS